MRDDEIMETFPEFETELRKKFRNYASVPDQKIEPTKHECDYLLILDGLVVSDQQTKMYQKLREVFCKSDPPDSITSRVKCNSIVISFLFSYKTNLIHLN